ncbi:MAG: 23S rRNA (guanosine(2251)-2'-O)-methyltransferase RlmB [Bacilli bacterium]
MLVYGKNVAKELLKKDNLIKKIYLYKDFDDKEILHNIKSKDIMTIYETKEKVDKLVSTNSQGIVLDIFEYHFKSFDDVLESDKASFIVVLDHIEDSHNFGAIIRTCECAGVDYIIIPNKRIAAVNATVMKTSAGALINTKICEVANLRSSLQKLKKKGFWIIGTDAFGTPYEKIDYKGKTVLVIGSEGKGLKNIIREECDFIASLPLNGQINSLNASVAAGIMIYEVLKTKD